MEQYRETQLSLLYDVLGFRRVIARYSVISRVHEAAPGLSSWQSYAAERQSAKRAVTWPPTSLHGRQLDATCNKTMNTLIVYSVIYQIDNKVFLFDI